MPSAMRASRSITIAPKMPNESLLSAEKNFLFVQSEDAGKELALLYSLVVSCDRLGKTPVTYLTDVLHRIDGTPKDRLAELLPDRWEPPSSPPLAADPISVD